MASRFGRFALLAFVVGLPLHNLAMAELWDLGVRGNALDAVSAWKEALLAVALALVVVERRGLPFKATATDWLAFAYGAIVLVYALIPQGWLGGNADAHGILFAVRHDLTPLAAYVLGRSLSFGRDDLRRIGVAIVAVAAAVAAWGLVDIYALGLDTWRRSGVPGWYREQLGLRYDGLSGLPENFVYNTGDERPLRRLVSTFLSPLATGYLLVVALLASTALGRRRWLPAATALAFVGLLFTYSRTSIAALALGLAVLAWALRSWLPLAAAVLVAVVGVAFVEAYPSIGPRDAYTPAELEFQRAGGQEEPTSGDATSFGESSVSQPPRQPPRRDRHRRRAIRGATGPGTPASPRSGRARRSRPASRPTPSWAPTSACSGCSRSSRGTSRSSRGSSGAPRGSPPRSRRCSRSGSRPT